MQPKKTERYLESKMSALFRTHHTVRSADSRAKSKLRVADLWVRVPHCPSSCRLQVF